MQYDEFPPRPGLAMSVERLWTLSGAAADLGGAAQPVLPDGRPELVLHFGDGFDRLHRDGRVERQPPVLFAGQAVAPLTLRPTGVIRVLGVRFHPYGAALLLKIPQHDLVGLTIGVDALSAPLSRALNRARDATSDPSRAVALVQDGLEQCLVAARLDRRVQHAVREIGRRRVSIDDLAAQVGLTRRHLERRFLETVGVSPKRLARIARFQHALRRLEQAAPLRRGTDTAAACGYADQSHFIRDFHDFAGCPPGEHLLRPGELTDVFTVRGRGVS